MAQVRYNKHKWKNERWGEINKRQNEEHEVNEEEIEYEMASTRVYDSREHTIDLRKVRVTKLSTNKRVLVPEQQGPEVEESLQHLKSRIEQASKSYMARECDERVDVKQKEERQG